MRQMTHSSHQVYNTNQVTRQLKDGNNTRQSIDGDGRLVSVTPVMYWQPLSRGVVSGGRRRPYTCGGSDRRCRTERFRTDESVGAG